MTALKNTQELEEELNLLSALGILTPCPVCGRGGLCGKDEQGNGWTHVSFADKKAAAE